jgi:cyclic-di-AMP phosphodiesterase PgpH
VRALKAPAWLSRTIAALIALVLVPLMLSVSAFLQDRPLRVDEPAPRTIVAPDTIRVVDPEATERARRDAASAVAPVLTDDDEARTEIVAQVRDAFATAMDVRTAGEDERPPTRAEQIAALRERLPMLDDAGLRLLTGLTESQLERVAEQAEQIAQQLALESIPEDRLEEYTGRRLSQALSVRSFPDGVDAEVVAPIIRDALRPTVREDAAATAEAREQAADEVSEVVRTYTRGSVIVSAGEPVDDVQFAALQLRGLEGEDPWRRLLQAFLLSFIVTLAVASYLRTYREQVWGSARRTLLLAVLLLLYAVVLEIVTLLPLEGSTWLFILPVGALAMLATILFDPPIGVLTTIPVTALVAFAVPNEPGLVVFAAVASLGSVPLVSRLSARGDLRRAAGKSTLGYVALAAICAGVFLGAETMLLAAGVGLLNGVATSIIVMGSLPFLESVFGVLTATSLLDLADRNHPLLRELEQKALGSYNHSIMVSTMVERACRAIGADGLLGSVAALYHDIGKVRRPYFFVENQFGVANPHDELEPRVSAIIIQEHVTHGIEMGHAYRLPAEVVDGIATHHGTTLVTYFYRKAVLEAEDPAHVDEAHFRYKGRKPSTKELAILMLADCCEGASRAAAITDRNLSRSDLEEIVHTLVEERVEDGQLDEAALTFAELRMVKESFIETLVGVYHPRIAYPKDTRQRPPTPVAMPGRADGQDAIPAAVEPDGRGGADTRVPPDGRVGGQRASDQPAPAAPTEPGDQAPVQR